MITGSTYWDNRAAQRANQPAQPDTSLFSLAEKYREVSPNQQDFSGAAILARRQAERGHEVTPPPAGFVPQVIGPAWTPPPGWVHTADGWNPPGTPEGVHTPMPAGYETYRRNGTSTNTPYTSNTTSQAYNQAQIARGGSAAPWPVSTGGIGTSNTNMLSSQQRANILSTQIQNGGNTQIQPNNGRPVGHEFANGVQMNPIMGGMKSEIRQPAPMQPFQQLPPMSRTMISPVGNYAPNGEVPANMQQAYLRQIAGNNLTQLRFNMPNGTQQAISQGAQQNQQQQLMALLSLLLNRG